MFFRFRKDSDLLVVGMRIYYPLFVTVLRRGTLYAIHNVSGRKWKEGR